MQIEPKPQKTKDKEQPTPKPKKQKKTALDVVSSEQAIITKTSKPREFPPREIFKRNSEEVIGFGDFVPAFMLKEPAKIPVELTE